MQPPAKRHRPPVKPLRIAEHFRKEPDRNNLCPHQCKEHPENHSVQIQYDVRANLPWAGQEPEDQHQPHKKQKSARQQKKPVRSVKKHEPQMSPAIPETSQVRWSSALVGP